MNKALSIHIGLNFVDPMQYEGWDGQLAACEADANDMCALAVSRGFKPTLLIREKATAKAVSKAIQNAATELAAGDILLVTYAGHGGQVPDLNGDEGKFGDAKDRKDETWCLFDREFIDDELAALWAKFVKGVRIVLISDSCHSASVVRARTSKPKGRFRAMPGDKVISVYRKHQALYDAVQLALKGSEQAKIKASMVSISGCMDNQLSSDGDFNGLFTGTLKDVWADGAFEGGYREFRDTIAADMPEEQTPVYFTTGAANPAFENEQPFTAKPKKTGKKASANPLKPKRISKRGGKPIDVVCKALNETGYTDPRDGGRSRPDSNIATWFRRVDREDDVLGVPDPQRTAQFVLKVQGAMGIPVSVTTLIRGDFPTPQHIADLA